MRYWLIALLVLTSAACGDDHPLWSDPTQIEFAPELEVDLSQMTRTESGLYIRDLTVGEGEEATVGDRVSVGYTGWRPDAFQFDTGVFEFQIGAGTVIRGWDQGIPGMRVGGVRQLVIPPSLAYGAGGAGTDIPPNTTLVFEVELLEILPDPEDGGAS